MKSGKTYIYKRGTAPETKAAISSKVKIFSYAYGESAGWIQIGVMSTFSPSQSRGADPIRGVGYGDQIAELVPGVSDPVTISVERTCLNLSNLFQVFGYKGGADGLVRALKHHRFPFDIRQEMVISELDSQREDGYFNNVNGEGATLASRQNRAASQSPRAIITIYEGCWMTSYDFSVSSDTSMISESTSISCTDIVDGLSRYGEFIQDSNSVIEGGGRLTLRARQFATNTLNDGRYDATQRQNVQI